MHFVIFNMKKVNLNKGKIGYKISKKKKKNKISRLFHSILEEENLNLHVPWLRRGPSI